MMTAAVIPAWNRRDDVLRLLGALADQTAPPGKTVVVDNASDDGTADAVASAFPDVVVLRQAENLGGAGGFNAGMAWAARDGADHVWLLDSDALPEPAALEELINAADATGAGLVGSALHDNGVVRDTGGRINFVRGALWWAYSGRDIADLPGGRFDVDCLSACSALVALDAVRATGAMRADYHVFYDDIEFSTRIRRSGRRLVVAPASRVRHAFPEHKPKTPWRLYYSVRNWLDFFLRYGRPVWRRAVATRQFAGAERLARSYEAAGATDAADACRRAIDDAREGRLGRVELDASTAVPDPAATRAGITVPLIRGIADAVRAKARGPEAVPLPDVDKEAG